MSDAEEARPNRQPPRTLLSLEKAAALEMVTLVSRAWLWWRAITPPCTAPRLFVAVTFAMTTLVAATVAPDSRLNKLPLTSSTEPSGRV